MKKIGIVTINGDYNYGNRLQNYALEQAIISLGFEVETVVFNEKKSFREYIRKFKNNLNKEYRIEKKNLDRMKIMKIDKFKYFRHKYLNNVQYKRKENFSDFDRFIVGSDQVWNPSWRLIDDYWLRFVPKNKRFSYAASMATTSIHKKNKNKLPKYLKEMNEISVREKESVSFIHEISGRQAEFVVDPTMLLKKSEYERLIDAHEHSKVKKDTPYILIYALEGLSEEMEKEVKKFSCEKGFDIIRIMGNKFQEGHIVCDPIEFVDSISNAEFVVSDSFHCGVFSILMETPFILFNRLDGMKMSSRITTLLTQFDLINQYYLGGELNKFTEIDYSKIQKKIETFRTEGMNYLSFILNKKI